MLVGVLVGTVVVGEVGDDEGACVVGHVGAVGVRVGDLVGGEVGEEVGVWIVGARVVGAPVVGENDRAVGAEVVG